jgi:hypothetical protein
MKNLDCSKESCFEKVIKEKGFNSVKEFHSLIASFDISTSLKNTLFKKWQHQDGTKRGLLNLKELLES